MAKRARAVLNGRFSPGTRVKLIEVRDESVMRPGAGDKVVDTQEVDKDGRLEFTRGVKADARYFAVGNVDGFPREVRLRGRTDDDDAINAVAPVQPDRVRLSDGSFLDEPPEQHQKPEAELEAAPHLGQHQVPKGQPQRSDTPRGSAHPHDPEEPVPYERQEDVKDSEVQASNTATGRAARVAVGPQRQEDVPKGTVQRSDTTTGVATVIPSKGPVKAQIEKESSEAKELRGEPVRAAAEPIEKAKPVKGASAKQSAKRQEEAVESVREVYEDAQPDEDAESALDTETTFVPSAAVAEGTEKAAKRAAKKQATTAKGKE
jgi:hypothetical protein